jgi:hypothetical protein
MTKHPTGKCDSSRMVNRATNSLHPELNRFPAPAADTINPDNQKHYVKFAIKTLR